MTASFLPGWKNPRANELIHAFRCSRRLQTVGILLLAARFSCFSRILSELACRRLVPALWAVTGLAAFAAAHTVALHSPSGARVLYSPSVWPVLPQPRTNPSVPAGFGSFPATYSHLKHP